MLSRDGVSGLICLAISVWLLVLTGGLPPAAMVPIGPAFYPRVVLSLTAVLSLILIVLDVRAMRSIHAAALSEPTASPATSTSPSAGVAPASAPNYRLVLATFIAFGLYVGLLPALGFRIATFLFVAALQITLEWPQSTKRWVFVVIVALATSLICFIAFEDLSVLLPRGRWSGM